MAQELTHNPLALNVGDTLWILKTTESVIKLEQEKMPRMNTSHILKALPCRVMKITQILKENNKEGTGGPRKRLFEYYLMPQCTSTNTKPIYATHRDPVFHTQEDLNKWLQNQIKTWRQIAKAHNERHEKIKEILYI